MIQSYFGIAHAPFTRPEQQPLLAGQQDILEHLRVHSHQRGFCIVAGSPGTGKTLLRQAFAQSNTHQVCPHITRTLHTYAGTLRILCNSPSTPKAATSNAKNKSSNKPIHCTDKAKPSH